MSCKYIYIYFIYGNSLNPFKGRYCITGGVTHLAESLHNPNSHQGLNRGACSYWSQQGHDRRNETTESENPLGTEPTYEDPSWDLGDDVSPEERRQYQPLSYFVPIELSIVISALGTRLERLVIKTALVYYYLYSF